MRTSHRAIVYTALFVSTLVSSTLAQTVKRVSCDGRIVHVDYANSNFTVPAEKDQVGCYTASVAPDAHTVAWNALFDNCCTSYPIATAIVILRDHHKVVVHPGQMVYEWHFVDRGQRIAVLFGPVHGDFAGANLYDCRSGALAATWKRNSPPPDWVKPWDHEP
jgi:hypothetical protein